MNATVAMLGWLGMGIGAFFLSLGLLITVFWIWALVDCARRIAAGQTRLVGWLIAICFLHLIGALAYVLFARRHETVQYARAV